MRRTIVLWVLFAATYAQPEGHFKQHYEYKSSSSSYKDNELQHKKDDEGFYSRQGDLQGRTEPKVNSYSQHSEYVNPKLQHGQGQNQASQNNDFYLQQTRGGAQGGYNTNLGSGYNTGTAGYTSGSGYNAGTTGYSTGASFNRGSSYSSSNSFQQQSGSTSGMSNDQIRALKDLQDSLAAQLQQALYDQQRHVSSSQSQVTSTNTGNYGSNTDYQYLENQLRNNISQQFNDAIRQQYQGQISNDRYNEYHQQLQNDLLRQLQSGSQTYNTQTSHNTQYGTSYVRPATIPGNSQTIHLTPGSQNTNSFDSTRYGTNTQTYRIPHPIPLSDVTSRLEIDIQNLINRAIHNKINTYTKTYGFQSQPDYYAELQRLTDELRTNITKQLETELVRTYGQQQQRGSHYYTITTAGPNSTPNYRVDELDRVRQELHNKLTRELQTKFQQQYTQYTQTVNQYNANTNRQSSTNSGQNTNYYGSSQGTYPTINPLSQNIHGIKTHGSPGHQYQPRPPTFLVTGNAPAELRRATETIHYDVFHDLQNALLEQQKRYLKQHNTQSTQITYNPQDYQVILQQLTNELRHNITKQLEKQLAIQYGHQMQQGSNYYSVLSGGGYSAAPNYNSQQLNDITQQLQNDLMQQLQTGLSKQFSSYSSYSSSSSYGGQASYSSTGQTGLKTHSNYSPYMSDGEMMQGDDSSYAGANRHYSNYAHHFGRYSNQDLTQQPEDQHGEIQIGRYNNINKGLSQQLEFEQTGYAPSHYGNQQREDFTQQSQNSYNGKIHGHDMSQKTEEELGQLQIGQQKSVDDQQHQEDFGQLQVGQQKVDQLTQNQWYHNKKNDQDQQREEQLGQLQIGQQKSVDDQQHQEDFGQLQVGQQKVDQLTQNQWYHNKKNDQDQQLGQLQIGQQKSVEDQQNQEGWGQLQVGQQKVDKMAQSQWHHNKKQDDQYQQSEEELGQLQIGQQKSVDDQQHQEDFGQLQVGQQKVDQSTQNQWYHSNKKDDQYQQSEEELGQLQIGQQKSVEDQENQEDWGQLQVGQQKVDKLTQSQRYHNNKKDDQYQQSEEELGQLQIGQQKSVENQQHPEDFGQLQVGQQKVDKLTQSPWYHNKKKDDQDQQSEEELGQLQVGQQKTVDLEPQNRQPYNQKMYEQDMTQQSEDEFGQLQIGQQETHNQQRYNQDQQSEEEFSQLQVGQQKASQMIEQSPNKYGQDMTQQTEEFGQLQIGQQRQKFDNPKIFHQMTQQTGSDFEVPHKVIDITQQNQESYQQKMHGEDMVQQNEDDYGQIAIGQLNSQKMYGQHVTQQNEDDVGQIQVGQQKVIDVSQQNRKPYNRPMVDQYIMAQHSEEEIEQLQVGQQKVQHTQNSYEQKINTDQQSEVELGQLQVGQHRQKYGQVELGQTNGAGKVIDITQQMQGSHNQLMHGKDMTQQTENFSQLQVDGQKVDLTQQSEEELGQLQVGHQKSHRQETYHPDMTQQTEEFGQLQIGQQKPIELAQQNQKSYTQKIFDEDMTQQTEDDEYGQLQIGQQKRNHFISQNQKPYTQRVHNQNEDYFGQTPQVEEAVRRQHVAALTQNQKIHNLNQLTQNGSEQPQRGHYSGSTRQYQSSHSQKQIEQSSFKQDENGQYPISQFRSYSTTHYPISSGLQSPKFQNTDDVFAGQLHQQEDLRRINEANYLMQILNEKINKQRKLEQDDYVQNSSGSIQHSRYIPERDIEYPLEPNTHYSSTYSSRGSSSRRTSTSSSYNHSY